LGPSGTVGPGTALTLATIQAGANDTNWVTASQAVQMSSPITRIRMANRPGGGAWVVWSLQAGIVSDAPALAPMFPVVGAPGTLVPASFAVDSMGSLLALAAVYENAGSNDQVQVAAIGDDGGPVWSETVQTEGKVEGALSVRAAPDGSALLLAWSELPAGATLHRVRVARVGCATCAGVGAACALGDDCCDGVCKGG